MSSSHRHVGATELPLERHPDEPIPTLDEQKSMASTRDVPTEQPAQTAFRSSEWFAKAGKYGFIPRSWMKSQGFVPEMLDGRPVIGICNT